MVVYITSNLFIGLKKEPFQGREEVSEVPVDSVRASGVFLLQVVGSLPLVDVVLRVPRVVVIVSTPHNCVGEPYSPNQI